METKASEVVKVPIVIGKVKHQIYVDVVVENTIPLLISKKTMKELKIKLDFDADTASIKDEGLPLTCTSTGHYCLAVGQFDLDTSTSNILLHMESLKDMDRNSKLKKAKKLHVQFVHAPPDKLIKLVKDSKDYSDENFERCIKEISETCKFCLEHKRPYRRPVVELPISNTFNEVVCMDLKEYKHNKIWIFHLIDSKTRYSAASLIKSKHKDTVVKEIYKLWVTYFGCPKKWRRVFQPPLQGYE